MWNWTLTDELDLCSKGVEINSKIYRDLLVMNGHSDYIFEDYADVCGIVILWAVKPDLPTG